jgi:hypothetical protein
MDNFEKILENELKTGAISDKTFFDIIFEKELDWERKFCFNENFSLYVKANQGFTAKDLFNQLLRTENSLKEKAELKKYRKNFFRNFF